MKDLVLIVVLKGRMQIGITFVSFVSRVVSSVQVLRIVSNVIPVKPQTSMVFVFVISHECILKVIQEDVQGLVS